MVTEIFLGWTVSSTHCLWSEANLWGSPARSQRSLREQLRSSSKTGREREDRGKESEAERENYGDDKKRGEEKRRERTDE